MKKPSSALLITLAAFFLGACSVPTFHSSQEKESAKISFSSMSDDRPELLIGVRGKSYAVVQDMIEKRRPGTPSTKIFNIPANEEITLTYNVLDIGEATFIPILESSANPYFGIQPGFEEHYTINSCQKNIAFTSEQNKKYEIFVEQARGIVCQIYIKEVINSLQNSQKEFKDVKYKILAN